MDEENKDVHVDQWGIDCEFYRESWEDADHPMAAVNLKNQFVRINHSFERLLGYSNAELAGETWMSVTRQADVGADLASVQSVVDGVAESYRMEKDYRHRRGHYVQVVLGVRRFPRASHKPLLMFRVEAPMATATRPELDDLAKEFDRVTRELRQRIEDTKEESKFSVVNHMGNRNEIGGDNSGFDQIGRNKTVNSNVVIVALVVAVIALGAFAVRGSFSASDGSRTIEVEGQTQSGQ